jgi:hypothetical protein
MIIIIFVLTLTRVNPTRDPVLPELTLELGLKIMIIIIFILHALVE